MEQTYQSTNYGGDAPANYEKFFVPSIGVPIAEDLLAAADPRPGERVLDVACGTGVVTRRAAKAVGRTGTVTGLDLNPGMLAIAKSSLSTDSGITWIEGDAETMPVEDAAFDVALCQMGLQFVQNKLAALREVRRALVPGGRVLINVPGPKPAIFAAMDEAIGRYLSRDAARFLNLVFSLHEEGELRDLFERSDFRDIRIGVVRKRLDVPPAREFLWQYIHSTPLAAAAAAADGEARDALEREVCANWAGFTAGDGMRFDVDITTVSARR